MIIQILKWRWSDTQRIFLTLYKANNEIFKFIILNIMNEIYLRISNRKWKGWCQLPQFAYFVGILRNKDVWWSRNAIRRYRRFAIPIEIWFFFTVQIEPTLEVCIEGHSSISKQTNLLVVIQLTIIFCKRNMGNNRPPWLVIISIRMLILLNVSIIVRRISAVRRSGRLTHTI